MYEKYKACEFGRCPRVLCNGQPCLPVGTCDVPRQSTVKIFCPKCQDIYYPRSKYQARSPGCLRTVFAESSYRWSALAHQSPVPNGWHRFRRHAVRALRLCQKRQPLHTIAASSTCP